MDVAGMRNYFSVGEPFNLVAVTEYLNGNELTILAYDPNGNLKDRNTKPIHAPDGQQFGTIQDEFRIPFSGVWTFEKYLDGRRLGKLRLDIRR